LGSVFSSIAFFSLNAFLFFISLFYLLRDGSGFKKAIISASPLSDSDDEAVFTRLENAVNSVIKGSLTIAVIQGTLVTLGFLVFGIPNSFLWGTLATVTALIPGLGTALVLGPGIIYLFLTGSQVAAFGLLIWGISAVGLIDNLIGPKLIGKNIQIHPLVILLAVLGGLAFFGPLGIFLGPLSAALFFSFLEIYMRPH
jgi:predicted PurR-regulated permease PerM